MIIPVKHLRNVLFVIAASILLSACSTPTVYLVTEGVSDAEQATLKTKLEQLNYRVERSNIAIPESFAHNTIAVNPGYQNVTKLEAIEQLLLTHTGNRANIQRFGEGNHLYFRNNIGVYVRNSENIQAFPNPFLRSAQCSEQDGVLNIKSNGRFHLEYVYYHDEAQILHGLNGAWQWQNGVLHLHFSDGTVQRYQHLRSKVQTYQGANPSDQYIPQETHASAIVNCSWQIVHMRR